MFSAFSWVVTTAAIIAVLGASAQDTDGNTTTTVLPTPTPAPSTTSTTSTTSTSIPTTTNTPTTTSTTQAPSTTTIAPTTTATTAPPTSTAPTTSTTSTTPAPTSTTATTTTLSTTTTTTTTPPSPKVKYNIITSQLIHRHGARYPIVSANTSILCPKGCGRLTHAGRAMLRHLGKAVRQHYTDTVPEGATWYPPLQQKQYNFESFYSRSTDVPRTMESADAFIRGSYDDNNEESNNNNFISPVVFNVMDHKDLLLRTNNVPAFGMYISLMKDHLEERLESLLPINNTSGRHHFNITAEVIAQLAYEVHLDKYCKEHTPVHCLMTIFDVAECWVSSGLMKTTIFLSQYYSQLQQLRQKLFQLEYGYNNKTHLDQERGSSGQILAQTLIQNFRDHIDNINNKVENVIKFREYSAHDTTLLPLAVTLGYGGESSDNNNFTTNTDDEMLPPFGKMYLLELVQVVEEDDDGDSQQLSNRGQALPPHRRTIGEGNNSNNTTRVYYAVQMWQASPQQEYESDYSYPPFAPLPLFGITSEGQLYRSTGNVSSRSRTHTPRVVLLDDFVRFIDSTRARSDKSYCYMPPSLLEHKMNCTGTHGVPSSNRLCEHYRRTCAQWACPKGWELHQTDHYKCTKKIGMSEHNTILLAVCSAVGGLIVGIALFFLIAMKRRRSGAEKVQDGVFTRLINTA